MRKISLDFLDDPDFLKWKKDAEKARASLIEGGRPTAFRETVWKELKMLLIRFNNGKCMYCEGDYTAGAHDDGDHYRPKREVTQCDAHTGRRRRIEHPGYYWLAYEWQNIFLSCTKCNSPHPDGEGGPHPGKQNEFPICGSCRVYAPSANPENWWNELKSEEPLLLHPYFDQPEEHFGAGLAGVIYGLTEEGRTTVNICDLNRPRLRTAREREERLVIRGRVFTILDLYLQKGDWISYFVNKSEYFSLYVNLCILQELENLCREPTGRKVTPSPDSPHL